MHYFMLTQLYTDDDQNVMTGNSKVKPEQILQINKKKKNSNWQFKAKGNSEWSKILGCWENISLGSRVEGSNLEATDDSRICPH